MMQGTGRSILLTSMAALVFVPLTACGGSDGSPTPPTTTPGARYTSQSFRPALEVTVPEWLPVQPAADQPHFLTWLGEGAMIDRGIRFLVPVTVYEPGSETATPAPDDYLAHLHGQTQHGASLADETTVTVDGRLATIVTATATASLDGSLGCPATDVAATDCFGLQPYLTLRVAVIDVDGVTVVAWARVSEDSADAAEVYADFEQMLASLRFR